MDYLRRFVASWPVAVLLGGAAVAPLGCQSILGVHDVSLDPTGAGGAATTSSTGTGGATTGTGGQSAGSFAFAVKEPSVNVPYEGLNYVNLEIIPSGGFGDAVDITVQGAPTGLVTVPLTLPAGSTTGRLQIGAEASLILGTKLTLTLVATSGSIVKTASVPAVVTGKPGDPDLDFNGGVVAGPKTTGWAGLYDIQELVAGKIVVGGVKLGKLGGGAGVAARFLSNGMPDTSFNAIGAVDQTFCSCSIPPNGIFSVARELDGTLLFAGSGNPGQINNVAHNDDIFLFRHRDNGVLDAIQGDSGVQRIDLGGDEQVTAAKLVPKSTDTIVVGSRDNQLLVAKIHDRYVSVDTKFAAPNGYIVPAIGGTASRAGAVALDPQGRIVVAGSVVTASGVDVVLLRLTADGALDATFGQGGFVILARPGDQHGSAVIIQPDGALVVAADTTEGSEPQLLVQRFLASGAPDPSFGTQGAVLAPLGNNTFGIWNDRTAWMVQMLDGRLVVAGNGTLGGVTGPVLARFLPDGSPDPTFGTNGELAVYVGMYGALGAMSLASDGKLLIAGTNSPNPAGASFLARLWN